MARPGSEPDTTRMIWLSYDKNMTDCAVFWNELDCLRYTLRRGWTARRVKWSTSLRDQVLDGDVVDAEIDYSEAYTELAEMRQAVLAIHKPCHTAETKPWVCGRHSDPEHDGYYRTPPVCIDCVDGDENAITYPCPTAQALGVPNG